jgi:hypothetical protein
MRFIKKIFISGLITLIIIGIIALIVKFLLIFFQPFKHFGKLFINRTSILIEIIFIILLIFLLGFIINFLEKWVKPISRLFKKSTFLLKVFNLFSSIKHTASYFTDKKTGTNTYVAIKISNDFYVLGMTSYNKILINSEERIVVTIIS